MRRCPEDDTPAIDVDGVNREARCDRLGARYAYNIVLRHSQSMRYALQPLTHLMSLGNEPAKNARVAVADDAMHNTRVRQFREDSIVAQPDNVMDLVRAA